MSVVELANRRRNMTESEEPDVTPVAHLYVDVRMWVEGEKWEFHRFEYAFDKISETLWSASTLMIVFTDNSHVVHPIHTIQQVYSV